MKKRKKEKQQRIREIINKIRAVQKRTLMEIDKNRSNYKIKKLITYNKRFRKNFENFENLKIVILPLSVL